jgi:hypothetical protein
MNSRAVHTAVGWVKGLAATAGFAFATVVITALLVANVPPRFVDGIVFTWIGSVIVVAYLARRRYLSKPQSV